MKWLDRLILRRAELININRKMQDERDYQESRSIKMMAGAQVLSKANPEGEDRITFELTTAVGGKILNVRRYDPRRDHHDSTTYVIPNGENLSERMVKILNLEMFK
jgi:hypothetical protein